MGWTREGDDEAVGHQSGRRIVELKRKKVAELSDDDYAHMKKVIGYVHRHRRSAQRGRDADALAILAYELGPRSPEGQLRSRANGA